MGTHQGRDETRSDPEEIDVTLELNIGLHVSIRFQLCHCDSILNPTCSYSHKTACAHANTTYHSLVLGVEEERALSSSSTPRTRQVDLCPYTLYKHIIMIIHSTHVQVSIHCTIDFFSVSPSSQKSFTFFSSWKQTGWV